MPPNISQPKDFFSWNREKNNRNKGSFSYPYPDKRLKYRLLHRFAAFLFSSHLKVTQRLAIYKRQKWGMLWREAAIRFRWQTPTPHHRHNGTPAILTKREIMWIIPVNRVSAPKNVRKKCDCCDWSVQSQQCAYFQRNTDMWLGDWKKGNNLGV